MTESLIQPSALFAFEVPCQPIKEIWQAKGALELPAAYRIPSFSALDERPCFGDLRLGWSAKGFGSVAIGHGKRTIALVPRDAVGCQ